MVCSQASFSALQETILSCVCWAWGWTSVLACLSILVSWLRTVNRPKITDASSMIICLTLCDMALGLNTIVEGSTSSSNYSSGGGGCTVDGVCIFKALVAQFFGMASFLWSACMCHSSYHQVTQIFLSFSHAHLVTQQQSSKEALLRGEALTTLRYHLLCWGLPGLSTLLMLATASAGPSGSHLCWVATDRAENDSTLPLSAATLLFLVPLLIIEVYHLVVFRFLARTLGLIPTAGPLLRRFTRVLALLIGSKTVLLLARALRLFVPRDSVFAIGVLSVVGAPLQGLADYLIFKYDERQGADLAYTSMRGSSLAVSESNSGEEGRVGQGRVALSPLGLAGPGQPGAEDSDAAVSSGAIYSPIQGVDHRTRMHSSAALLGSEHGDHVEV